MSIIERSALSKNETHQTFANGWLCHRCADILVTVKDTALRDVLVDSSRAAYPPAQVTLLRLLQPAGDSCWIGRRQVNQNPEATVVVTCHGGGLKAPMNTFWCQISYQMVNVRG